MRFRFIPNEVLTVRSFGGVSDSRDPLNSGVRQQETVAPAGRAVVDGHRICAAHRHAHRRLGSRRTLPFVGQRETLSFLAWALVAGYALVLYRYQAQAVGAFAMPLISILTFLALLISPDSAVSAAKFSTTWLFPIHTTMLIFAYAAFFIVFMASVMYLLQERELKLKTFSGFFYRLPALSTVNEIATHAAALGLTLLTLGLVAGVFWNWSLHGQMWRNDPKEIFAVLTWLLYFVLAIYRSTANWRGRRAAWLGVFGFVLVLCTFLAAPLLGSYHVFGMALL